MPNESRPLWVRWSQSTGKRFSCVSRKNCRSRRLPKSQARPSRQFRRGFIAACRCCKPLSEETPMPLESHEKARFLLHRSLVEGISVEGISPEDRHWLDAHVGQCAECGRYAELSARAVGALDWFAIEPDPEAALRVENVIRSRAEGMRSAEAGARSLWIGTAIAIFLTVTGSAVTWRPLAWLAVQWDLPSGVWQVGFVAFWLLPSLLLALLPLFRRRLMGEDSDNDGETV
jgi:hypothetical protein